MNENPESGWNNAYKEKKQSGLELREQGEWSGRLK